MAFYYQRAYTIPGNLYAANALANWFEAEHLLTLLGKRKWGDVIKGPGTESYRLPSSMKSAADELSKLKNSMLNLPPDKMDYRDMVGMAAIELSLCIFSVRQTSANDLLNVYKKIWDKAGSQGKKLAEIEHFDFLLDAYGQVSKNKIPGVLKLIRDLKTGLSKMI